MVSEKNAPTPELVHRLEHSLERRPLRFTRVRGGYTPAERWIVEFVDGSSAFAKLGTTEDTAASLREEQRIYASVRGAFLPRHLAWDDDEQSPLLVLEDLSHGFWPPPWSSTRVDAVLAALDVMHSTAAPARTWDEARFASMGCWEVIASDPGPFLALGLVSPAWLERALPTLLSSQARVETEGSCLIHFDVRSDNVCVVDGRALLVDWNCACLGNPKLDLGFWLPSLAAEGGPEPESLLPDAAHIASWVSGFFAARAGQPFIPHAPRVRQVQRLQLDTALPWAVRSLDLAPPDGPGTE